MHEWVTIFKILGNANRLRILKLLCQHRELSVKEIRQRLDMTLKLASQYLVLLSHAKFLQSTGKFGSVYYSLHPKLRPEVRHIIQKFVSK